MKRKKTLFLLFAVILFLFFAVYSVIDGRAQSPQISSQPDHLKKAKKSRSTITVSNETELLNSAESENGLGLIETPTASNSTVIKISKAKLIYAIAATLRTPTNFDSSKVFGTVGLSVSRPFENYDIALKGAYTFSQFKSFAVVGAEVGRSIHFAEEVELRPYSNFSFYIPTESSNNHVSKGVVWSNGFEFEGKVYSSILRVGGKLIADSGSIHPGKRFGVNTEVAYLHLVKLTNTRGFYIGPKIGYTNFLYANSASELEKRSKLIYGVVFKLK